MNPGDVDNILTQAAAEAVRNLTAVERHSPCISRAMISAHREPMDRRLSGSLLQPSFRPTPYSVIVGRGKETKENPGNQRLLELAMTYLEQYSEAKNDKQTKTKIVSNIVAIVHDRCPSGGGFIKRTTNGQWYEVDNSIAREKVGYIFRDLLADKYRSSSKSKLARKNNRCCWEKSEMCKTTAGNASKICKNKEVLSTSCEQHEKNRNSIFSFRSAFDSPTATTPQHPNATHTSSSFQQNGVFDLSGGVNLSTQSDSSMHQRIFHDIDYDPLLSIPLLPFED